MHSGALKSVLKRRSFGALVLTAFGTFWALVGASGLNAAAGWLPLLVLSLIAILLFVASIRLIRAVRRMSPASAPSEERKRSRNYRLINMLQVVAMMGAVAVLSLIHPRDTQRERNKQTETYRGHTLVLPSVWREEGRKRGKREKKRDLVWQKT
jgi:hypothetical protein